jgi:subtilisin family serine protease
VKDFPIRIRHHSGAIMELERDRVLVGFGKGPKASSQDRTKALEAIGLTAEDPVLPAAASNEPAEAAVNHTDDRIWARTLDGSAFRPNRAAESDQLSWVAPVYRLPSAGRTELLSPLPHALLVRIKNQDRRSELEDRLRKRGLKADDARSKYLGDFTYFVVDPTKTPAYELKDQILTEEGQDIQVELELMPMHVPTAFTPNDPQYPAQWNMARIAAGGTGQSAWNMQRGDPDIVVCILDEGCQLDHPDLLFAADGINLGTMMPTGAPTGNHGTPCAGIAAATIHNSTGVAGVAGGCSILPVAFSAWTDVEVAAGIRFAAENGARVISMSFGWDPWNPAIIDPAIQDAFDSNVVMCVATHNYNTADGITYPATNALVMACGASDQDDDRKSPASPDGEPWGSNYGPQMSVVAPGVLCPSTDRLGASGYSSGDYVPDFNGTSAATPHVAGLAALLLSCDASLSNVDVRDIIEQTANKVGSVAYANTPGYPNGTWNEEMGYGRINARSAVRRVCKTLLTDIKPIIDQKPLWFDESAKLRSFKEKERGDEVKGLVGYEVPDFINPKIIVEMLRRLEQLEKRLGVGQGKPFIEPGERPPVGEQLLRQQRARAPHQFPDQ